MYVVDVNVLLYAVDESSPHHAQAKNWLDSALNAGEPVAFAWVVILAFLRLATHPRVFSDPLTPDQAFETLDEWLQQASAIVLDPTRRHLGILNGLLRPLGTGANLVGDAHLASLALEHGAEVVTFDVDFIRFTGVRSRRP